MSATDKRARRDRGARIAAALVVALITVGGVAWAARPTTDNVSQITWSAGVPQPVSNSEQQGEVVGGRLYVFGGFDSQKACCTPTSRAYVYDFASNVWTPIAPMPPQDGSAFGGVTHAGFATDGRDIFWAGGYRANSAGTGQVVGTREVWRYQPDTDTYARIPDLPTPLAAGALEYLDGKLHYFGGTNQPRTVDLTSHYVLDLSTEATTWTTADQLPSGRHHLGSAVVGGKIYAVGGQKGHDANLVTQRDVDVWDPVTGQWSTAPADLPGGAGRSHIGDSTFRYGGRVIVAGGEFAPGTRTAEVIAYNPSTNSWSFLTSLPVSRGSGVAGVLGGQFIYTTGSGSSRTFRGKPQLTSGCGLYSQLNCGDVKPNLPFEETFDRGLEGLYDSNGDDIGFTLVQPSSRGGAYRPELLRVRDGSLALRTTAGIQFGVENGSPPPENAQDNALGIGVDGSQRLRIETRLADLPARSGQSEQAGLWFGPDEDNYAKLAVLSTGGGQDRIQLAREVGGVSGSADAITVTPPALTGKNVRLVMTAEPTARKVTASYRVDGAPAQSIGELTLPLSFFDGSRLTTALRTAGTTALAGIFGSHRNSLASVTYRFADFFVSAPDATSGQPNVDVSPTSFLVNDPIGRADGPTKTVTIRNTGSGRLNVDDTSLAGVDASQFRISRFPAGSVKPGGQTKVDVTFAPTTAGVKDARLDIRTDDPDFPLAQVTLRGLGSGGTGGTKEPSLQWVLDAHGFEIDVGDDDPSTAVIHSDPEAQRAPLLGDEIPAQAFERAGPGSVRVEPLAVFGPDTKDPVVRMGIYDTGSPGRRTQLLEVGNSPRKNAQTVEVNGTGPLEAASVPQRFGFYSTWTAFSYRTIFSEDAENTFEGAIPHHVRVFPYVTNAGTVPNAYVVAMEESPPSLTPDGQDIVFVVRNVQPVALVSGGKISVSNLDDVPYDTRLTFNRIQTPNSSLPNGVHDTAILRVRNTASAPLVIDALSINGPWQLVNAPSLPHTIPPGGLRDLTVKFTAQAIGSDGGLYEGTLSIHSDDAAKPLTTVELGGFWQSVSEGNQEPTIEEVMKAYGYRTLIARPGETTNSGGELKKIGEEVHSAYWRKADPTRQVSIRQLAALHTQGDKNTIATTLKATAANSPSSLPAWKNRLTHYGLDGQSFLPRADGEPPPGPAFVQFNPASSDSGTTTGTDADDGTFGFKIGQEFSDWTMNRTGNGIDTGCLSKQSSDPSVQCGHHLRTWPIRNRAGELEPNVYLVTMDTAGINYDFQDNMYLVSNIRPERPEDDPAVCRPIDCSKVAAKPPLALDFDQPVSDTVADSDSEGTGFTWVDAAVDARYLPGRLNRTNGRLEINTTAGLAIDGVNTQDNGLGVGLHWRAMQDHQPLLVETRILDVPAMSGKFEQAGLWFGRGQDDYLKVHVFSGGSTPQIEFLKEEAGGVTRPGGSTARFRSSPVNLTGQGVDLRLRIDPLQRQVTATWNLVGGSPQTIGSFSVPRSWLDQDQSAIDTRTSTSSYVGIFASHRNASSPLTFSFGHFRIQPLGSLTRPSVTAVRPPHGATAVARDVSIGTDLSLPNGGIADASLTPEAVRLVRVADGQPVAGTVGTSGGGDTIVFTPQAVLAPTTQYRFEVSDDVKDVAGAAFQPFSSTFTTRAEAPPVGSADIKFEKVPLPTATGEFDFYSTLAIGPDGHLYAGMNDGRIRRFPVDADGTLGTPQTITSLVPQFSAEDSGTKRLLTGIRFDPAATSQNPILWASHSTWGFSNMPDWGGKITRLSGADLQNVQDYVIGLPRSTRDHVTNGIDFGPDGLMYVLQGSNSAMGAPDSTWGQRPERLLSAALLQINPSKITTPPVNVQTEEGGTYDPFGANPAVKLYATGIRNAYDLVWHSNGQLYVPTNGSAAGGSTPATPTPLPASCSRRIDSASNGAYTGPEVPGLSNVRETQHDWLFRILQNKYYGHPNPARCEWAMNGGNPTSSVDPAEVAGYPVGTLPDRNWRGAAYDFGTNKSPNGILEYKSNVFGGQLQGRLVAVRYSQNDDLIVLRPGGSGDITEALTNLTGMTGFKDPLDVVELRGPGYLYVAEYDQLGSGQRLTLLRPIGASSTGCAPISPLSCDVAKVPTPFTASWEAGQSSAGVQDRNGQSTSLPVVQPNGPDGRQDAYRPEDLLVSGGRLTVTATDGIQYRTPSTTTGRSNQLENGLGIALGDTGKIHIETRIVNPPLIPGGRSEQAGIWLGPDQDNYVKLVVTNVATNGTTHHRIQLARETAGSSDVPDEVNFPARGTLSVPPPNWSSSTVRLILDVDPTTRIAEAWYQADGGTVGRLGELQLDARLVDGSLVPTPAASSGIRNMTGVFASRRFSTSGSPVLFSFEDFSVSAESSVGG